MLGEEDYAVVGQAGDGQKAVELAKDSGPTWYPRRQDALLDGTRGRADRRRADRARGHPHRLLQRDLVERARDAGAMAYLVKPFTRRPGAGDRDGGEPLRRGHGARGRGGRPPRVARDAQAVDRAKSVLQERSPSANPSLPVDSEDSHGSSAVDAPGGRRSCRARYGPTWLPEPSATPAGRFAAAATTGLACAGHGNVTTSQQVRARPGEGALGHYVTARRRRVPRPRHEPEAP